MSHLYVYLLSASTDTICHGPTQLQRHNNLLHTQYSWESVKFNLTTRYGLHVNVLRKVVWHSSTEAQEPNVQAHLQPR